MPQGKRRIFFVASSVYIKILRFGCAFYPAKILGFFVLRYETCVGFFTVVKRLCGKNALFSPMLYFENRIKYEIL